MGAGKEMSGLDQGVCIMADSTEDNAGIGCSSAGWRESHRATAAAAAELASSFYHFTVGEQKSETKPPQRLRRPAPL